MKLKCFDFAKHFPVHSSLKMGGIFPLGGCYAKYLGTSGFQMPPRE